MPILVLPPDVAAENAAGEVIERPGTVERHLDRGDRGVVRTRRLGVAARSDAGRPQSVHAGGTRGSGR